jgi:hypothetical protein
MADLYKVRTGEYQGLIGKMIARYADASYNDITLQFDDCTTKVFQFREVEKVDV